MWTLSRVPGRGRSVPWGPVSKAREGLNEGGPLISGRDTL